MTLLLTEILDRILLLEGCVGNQLQFQLIIIRREKKIKYIVLFDLQFLIPRGPLSGHKKCKA